MKPKNRENTSDPRQLGLFDFEEIQVPSSTSKDKQRQQSEGCVAAPTRDEGMTVRRKSSKRRKSIVAVTSPLHGLIDCLTDSARRVYCYLRDESMRLRRDSDGEKLMIAAGYASLQQKVTVSKRTIARSLKQLENIGLIKQHRPALGSKRATKSYQVYFLDEILPTGVEEGIEHRASVHAESHALSNKQSDKMKPNTAAGQKPKRSA